MRKIVQALALASSLLSASVAFAGTDPTPRIEVVGGAKVPAADYPWVVHLSMGCAGTLIQPAFVLTAAHWAGPTGSNTRIRIKAGSHDLNDARAAVVSSLYVKRASGFQSVTKGRDWAVIKLNRALDLPTLRLSSGGADDTGVFTVMGWGTTGENEFVEQRYLRSAKVPLVGDTTCRAAYAPDYKILPAEMLCAGNVHRGRVDTCQGDSGGPMVKRTGSSYVQVGIVSWGVGCARKEYPGVYTQVSHFAGDIRKAVEDMR